jgi:outer membrane protein assembly factor BamB
MLAAVLFLFCNVLSAKRSAPQAVTPIELNGVKYAANVPKAGYVSAMDVKTGKVLWSTEAYRVIKDNRLEQDVQDIYVNSMKIAGGKLVVSNERSRTYKMILKTGKPQGPVEVIDMRRVNGK